jgi:hypothetical protein
MSSVFAGGNFGSDIIGLKDGKYATIQFTDKSEGSWVRDLYADVTGIGEIMWVSSARTDYRRDASYDTNFAKTDYKMNYNQSVEMKVYIDYRWYAVTCWTKKFTVNAGDNVEFIVNTYGIPYRSDIVVKINGVEVTSASS